MQKILFILVTALLSAGFSANSKEVIKFSTKAYSSPSLKYFIEIQDERILVKNRKGNEVARTKQFTINGAFSDFDVVWNESESIFLASFFLGNGHYKKLIVETATGTIMNCENPKNFYDCHSSKPRYSVFMSEEVVVSIHKDSSDYDGYSVIDVSQAPPLDENYILPEKVQNMQHVSEDLFVFRSNNPGNERVLLKKLGSENDLCSVSLGNDMDSYAIPNSKLEVFAILNPYETSVSFYNFRCEKLFSKELRGMPMFQGKFGPDNKFFVFQQGGYSIQEIDLGTQSIEVTGYSDAVYGIKWNEVGDKLILFGKENVFGHLLLKATSYVNDTESNSTDLNGSIDLYRQGRVTWGPLNNNSFYLIRDYDTSDDEIHIHTW